MKLAFVVQRYGEEVNGGSELLCRRLAGRLARRHAVEVFTTTALDYMTWAPHYPAGRGSLNGVTINRFDVDRPRDVHAFNQYSRRIFGKPHTPPDELEWMRQAGPLSGGFLRALAARRTEFDVIFFLTCEYATTYFGLQLAPEHAVLIPTAHDSPVLRLDIFRATFRLPRHIVYLTPAEKSFVEQRFANADVPNSVVGAGIEPPPAPPDAARFRARFGISGDFALYIGRIDEAKGCGELFDFFARHAAQRAGDLKLVLMGRPVMAVPKHPRIVMAGFVDEQTKHDGLAAATLLVAPSPYESLSMTCQEAWQAGKPVLVNGRCAVLRDQVERSGGAGWVYHNFDSFAAALDEARGNSAERARRGASGRQFVERTYSWEVIEAHYEDIIRRVASATPVLRAGESPERGPRTTARGT
ncbi:MAG: glycosyltransferase family 4 protein [Verrucomicrobia bacterium]|nr:glycosyltransferase family 4 protein [Verrucomicrobiota bacterium]